MGRLPVSLISRTYFKKICPGKYLTSEGSNMSYQGCSHRYLEKSKEKYGSKQHLESNTNNQIVYTWKISLYVEGPQSQYPIAGQEANSWMVVVMIENLDWQKHSKFCFLKGVIY